MRLSSLHLCAGIGGGMLADTDRGDIMPVAACEIDAACRRVLALRFPSASLYGDLFDFNKNNLRGFEGEIDIISGGFPCQSVSVAGKQEGFSFGSGTKSSLVWEVLKTINVVRPKYVFLENVANIVSSRHRPNLDLVLGELGHMGYGGSYLLRGSFETWGSPHVRRRFWLLAEAGKTGWSELKVAPTYTNKIKGSLWTTPVVGGRGTYQFMRKDGKVRDSIECQAFMAAISNELGIDPLTLSPAQVKEHLAGRFLRPEWVEQLMGFPVGWTDLWVDEPPTVYASPVDSKITYSDQKAVITNPTIGVPVKNISSPWSVRHKQLGNAQDPIVAAFAFDRLKSFNATIR